MRLGDVLDEARSRTFVGRGAELTRFDDALGGRSPQRVFLVLSGQGRVRVSLDGRPQRAVDVRGTPRLYTVLARPSPTRGLLELRFPPGVAGWAFTFG